MKPIYFPPPVADKEIRAILEDRKTVTRRMIKEPYYIEDEEVSRISGLAIHRGTRVTDGMPYPDRPYRPGDILYVRETWARIGEDIDPIWFEDPRQLHLGQIIYRAEYPDFPECKWRPSIHMPKEAARIFLRVTDVRVERVRDITVEGVLQEGMPDVEPPSICKRRPQFPDGFDKWSKERRDDWFQSTARATYIGWCDYADTLMRNFKAVWGSTIKPAYRALYCWEANPWVWVIAFERISKEEAYELDRH